MNNTKKERERREKWAGDKVENSKLMQLGGTRLRCLLGRKARVGSRSPGRDLRVIA